MFFMGTFLRSLNDSSMIIFVLSKRELQILENYRHINLVEGIYKIFAKVNTNQLKSDG